MPKAAKIPRIPKRIQRIADYCRLGGQTLHLANPVLSRGETKRRYWFEPSGRPAPTNSAEEAIGRGLMVPCGDSLFGGADSQSFRAA